MGSPERALGTYVAQARDELGASQLVRAWLVRPQLETHKRNLKHMNGDKSLALTWRHDALARLELALLCHAYVTLAHDELGRSSSCGSDTSVTCKTFMVPRSWR